MLFDGKKKAQADSIIFIGMIIIFVAFGAALPFIQRDFESSSIDNNNVSSLIGNMPPKDTNPVTAPFSWFTVLFSIIKMFFWTFSLPIWAELIIEIFRIILYLLTVRLIRGV